MDRLALARVADRIESLASEDPFMKEANVKLRVVQPLLAALGWDTTAGDVEMEWSVRVGRKTVAVDFALLLEKKAVVFVETKSFDSNLDKDDAQQAISYGRVEGVKWCVLTNGKELNLYDSSESKEPEESLVTSINLAQVGSESDEIRLLSKEALVSQEIETLAKTKKAIIASRRKLDESRSVIAAAFAGALAKSLPDLPPDLIKELAEKAFAKVQAEVRQAQAKTEGVGEGTKKAAPTIKVGEFRGESAVRSISRRDIDGPLGATVLVCPARLKFGIDFLFKYEAWAFLRINRRPDYLALYLTKPISKILYVGEVDRVSPPLSTRSDIEGIADEDLRTFTSGKRIIWLKKGSIRKLSDPIPSGRLGSAPQSPRYTTLKQFISAKDTGDLLRER